MFSNFQFDIEEDEFSRSRKQYACLVENEGMTYNMHEAFNMEGYFSNKVTHLVANKFLMEELVEGEHKCIMEYERD